MYFYFINAEINTKLFQQGQEARLLLLKEVNVNCKESSVGPFTTEEQRHKFPKLLPRTTLLTCSHSIKVTTGDCSFFTLNCREILNSVVRSQERV